MRIIKFLSNPSRILVLIAFFIGCVLRIWDFGNLPAGLSEDEASISVEAQSLYHYGIDRNGESYPVHFIAWGSGQNSLYAYLLIPLVPLGLTPAVVRLPMLISGLLTLVIVYGIAKKLFSPTTAILAIFLLAVSPWHISISRWALESNLFPFMFSLAFLCLLNMDRHPVWFPVSMALMALSLYSYGTSYFIVPSFLFFAIAFLLIKKIIPWKTALLGIAAFSLLAIPMLLFILVNTFGWNTMHLGLITIPRMTAQARIIEMYGFFGGGNAWYYYDALATAKILFMQTDGIVPNFIPPFGYLFPGAIFFSLIGVFLAAEKFIRQKLFGVWAFGVWLTLAVILGMMIPPAVHRMNILFIPLILCAAVAMDWIIRDKRILAASLALGIGVYIVLFYREYTGPDYRGSVGWEFNNGLIPAIQQAVKNPDLPVCITNEADYPYVYVELVDRRNPKDYLVTMQYLNPVAKSRVVIKMDRYSFGIQNCTLDAKTIYIIKIDQKLPLDESNFTSETFDNYIIYIPKH